MADANGAAVATTVYDPWGDVYASSGTIPTTLRYTGQREEPGIGLYDYKARWYDPWMGRFIQPDPIVPDLTNPQALNRYTYCLNNPVRYTDPSGYIAWDEQEEAMRIIGLLGSTYGVEVHVDFGWVDVPHPAPGEAGRQWNEGAWELPALYTLLHATADFAYQLFGGAQGFKDNVGRLRVSGFKGGKYAGLTWQPYAFKIEFNTEGLTKWTVAHEFGHAWDQRHFGKYSSGMGVFVETGYDEYGEFKHLGQERSWVKGAPGNRAEDWAESVAAYVYPVEARRQVRRFVDQDTQSYPKWYSSGHYFRDATSRALFVQISLGR